jgi:hypothetical protein
MAHIIDLACGITDIRSRYLKIHGSVFGLSVRRSASLLQRRTSVFYGDRECELYVLEAELMRLESALAEVDADELTKRARNEVHATLVQYTGRLVATVGHLKEICRNLSLDEAAYRRSADNGESRFRHDQIRYDYSIQELKRWGAKMNDLFSTF